MTRSICVNYCDDIRNEIGNKISLIGLYGPDLIVPSLPALLPKLCMFVQIFNNIGESFEGTLVVRILLDDEIVAEEVHKDAASPVLAEGGFETRLLQIVMSPFEIRKECKLRVRAYFDEEEVKGSALNIRAASTTESVEGPSK